MSIPAAVVMRQQEIDALEFEVSMIAARLNQAHADLVVLTVRLLEDERWAGDGIRSPEHWLVLHAGLSPARAGEVVRLARRAEALPTTMTALAAGQLSMDQAAVVARYPPSSHEQSIGQLAPMTTVPQLRRALSRYQFATKASPASEGSESTEPGEPSESSEPTGENPPPADPLGRDERDVPGTEAFALKAAELSMSYADGRFVLRYSGPADVGALVEQAIREAKDALFAAGQTTATYADGLAEVASRSLASVESESRAARYRVYLHLSTDGAWVGGGVRSRCGWRRSTRATGSCSRCGRRTARRSAWAASSGARRLERADWSRTAIVAASSRGAKRPGSWRSITSTTGPRAAAPTSTAWYACARLTMTVTTAVSSPSPGT